ncbi:hypothetical protein BC834DRAFT_844612 [Gloeopeniophorella convolvens]|nr:hypothetical protein BC834DRAFT_844612 [Gloeopeniophorella convolvens]
MGRHEWVTSRMPTHAIPGWDLRRNRLRSDHMLVKRAVVCSLAEKPAALVRPLRGTRLRESSPASWASRETEPYHYRSSAAKPGEWGMRRVCRGLGALENCLSDDSQGPVIQPSNKPRRRYKSQPYQRVRLAPPLMGRTIAISVGIPSAKGAHLSHQLVKLSQPMEDSSRSTINAGQRALGGVCFFPLSWASVDEEARAVHAAATCNSLVSPAHAHKLHHVKQPSGLMPRTCSRYQFPEHESNILTNFRATGERRPRLLVYSQDEAITALDPKQAWLGRGDSRMPALASCCAAVRDPTFWGNIASDLGLTCSAEMFVRAKSSPFKISPLSSSSYLPAILSHLSHIRRLLSGVWTVRRHLTVDSHLRRLSTTLTQLGFSDGAELFVGQAPRLRGVRFDQVDLPWIAVLPRNHFVYIEIAPTRAGALEPQTFPRMTLGGLVEILSNCPALQSFAPKHCLPPTTSFSQTRVIHVQLTKLECLALTGRTRSDVVDVFRRADGEVADRDANESPQGSKRVNFYRPSTLQGTEEPFINMLRARKFALDAPLAGSSDCDEWLVLEDTMRYRAPLVGSFSCIQQEQLTAAPVFGCITGPWSTRIESEITWRVRRGSDCQSLRWKPQADLVLVNKTPDSPYISMSASSGGGWPKSYIVAGWLDPLSIRAGTIYKVELLYRGGNTVPAPLERSDQKVVNPGSLGGCGRALVVKSTSTARTSLSLGKTNLGSGGGSEEAVGGASELSLF